MRVEELTEVVSQGFKSETAKRWLRGINAEWHAHEPGRSYLWDSGPCLLVAKAIAAFDQHRGSLFVVRDDLGHIVYGRDGCYIDGYGRYFRKDAEYSHQDDADPVEDKEPVLPIEKVPHWKDLAETFPAPNALVVALSLTFLRLHYETNFKPLLEKEAT